MNYYIFLFIFLFLLFLFKIYQLFKSHFANEDYYIKKMLEIETKRNDLNESCEKSLKNIKEEIHRKSLK